MRLTVRNASLSLVGLGIGMLAALGAAGGTSSRVMLLVRTGSITRTLEAKSVSFNHATVGRRVLGSATSTTTVEIAVALAAGPSAKAVFKPGAELTQVDLVLYVTTDAGRQHLRSQVEIGHGRVAEYKLSADKKTATVKIASKAVFVTEPSPTGNADWVASG